MVARKRAVLSILASIYLLAPCGIESANAYSARLSQGISFFNQKHYDKALPVLKKAVRDNPLDANGHYYLGLCYQELKQNSLARQHFQWVVDAGKKNPKLRANAQIALDHLSKAKHYGKTGLTPIAENVPSLAPEETAAQHGRCTILLIESPNNKTSLQFSKEYMRTARKYGRYIEFRRLNGTAPENAYLKTHYKIGNLPWLVYLNKKGKILHSESRVKFQSRVKDMMGKRY